MRFGVPTIVRTRRHRQSGITAPMTPRVGASDREAERTTIACRHDDASRSRKESDS
jgi:hypothetical protein